MEILTFARNSRKYRFKKGDEVKVLRTIMGECVLVTGDNSPNIILSEKKALYYGKISGVPAIGGV